MTFARYGLVQVVAYLIDMGGFLLLFRNGLAGALTANVVAKLAAGLFAFVAHRHFTFDAGTDRAGSQALRYFLLLALNIPLSSAVLALLLLWIPEAAWAKFAADTLIVALTYWASKLLIFSPARNRARARTEGTES